MLEFMKAGLNYGHRQVLQNIDLSVAPGERYGLLGRSGAGKSSLLRLAAGIVGTSSGTCINRYRYPALLFQEPRLLPWRSVLENIVIPLTAMGVPRREAIRRAAEWIDKVDLQNAADTWPGELSGGMAQRAALARAFALQPDLLLLDEPFSALDPALRASLSALCTEYVRETGAALICSSHHPHELVRMVDSCLLISHGRLHRHDVDAADSASLAETAQRLHFHLLDHQDSAP